VGPLDDASERKVAVAAATVVVVEVDTWAQSVERTIQEPKYPKFALRTLVACERVALAV
jgi:hypothetical protein